MLKRKIEFQPGYDCIRFECKFGSKDCAPTKGGSHGKHSMTIRFLLIGELGAVGFVMFSGDWYPEPKLLSSFAPSFGPMAADLGYHSLKPQWDGLEIRDCEYLPGGKCYYDGSGLNAEEPMRIFFNDGEEALWSYLEECYQCEFQGKSRPKPRPYHLKERVL